MVDVEVESDYSMRKEEMRFQKTYNKTREKPSALTFSLNLSLFFFLDWEEKRFINSFSAFALPLLTITSLVTGAKLKSNIVSG